ncbi:hypothetical protein ACC687_42680, partial [Rhizobium ruizarguesonis]
MRNAPAQAFPGLVRHTRLFGATGDLTRRLLVPAIINLTRSRLVGEDLHILGIGIEPGDDEFLRGRLDQLL